MQRKDRGASQRDGHNTVARDAKTRQQPARDGEHQQRIEQMQDDIHRMKAGRAGAENPVRGVRQF